MSKLNTFLKFLNYNIKSTNQHGVHSPFVFDLVTKVIYDKSEFYCFKEIEKLRHKLKNSTQQINHIDLGAGSKKNKNNELSISDIAKYSLKSPKYSQLLFRLVNYFQPPTIIELGTSLGISAAYMASANKNAKVITMEGSPEIAAIAKNNFDLLSLNNIELTNGNFDNTLSTVLNKVETVDFIFFDGNHQYQPTINYFTQCLNKTNNNSVFIFDDIYWSDEMNKAWQEIKNHTKTKVTIDLFQMGIVFFREEQAKEHFVIRF